MSAGELLQAINTEDRKVPEAIAGEIPVIEKVVLAIVERMKRGGRVFYLGAGTSGMASCSSARRSARWTAFAVWMPKKEH